MVLQTYGIRSTHFCKRDTYKSRKSRHKYLYNSVIGLTSSFCQTPFNSYLDYLLLIMLFYFLSTRICANQALDNLSLTGWCFWKCTFGLVSKIFIWKVILFFLNSKQPTSFLLILTKICFPPQHHQNISISLFVAIWNCRREKTPWSTCSSLLCRAKGVHVSPDTHCFWLLHGLINIPFSIQSISVFSSWVMFAWRFKQPRKVGFLVSCIS